MRPAPFSLRAGDGELADRAAAEHGHGVAGLDLRELRTEVAGREDVREQDRLVVAHAVGQLHQVRRRERDARVLGLQAVEAAARARRRRRTRCRRGPLGLRDVALRIVAVAAVRAVAAGDGRRNDDAVADARSCARPCRLPRRRRPPRDRGSCRASCPCIVPRTKCRSVPQIALAVMRTMASVGSLIFGSRTSSSRMSPIPWKTTAFIAGLLGGA